MSRQIQRLLDRVKGRSMYAALPEGKDQRIISAARRLKDEGIAEPVVLTVGLAEGIRTPSSFFLMVVPEFQGVKDRPLIYADCGVNVVPTPAQLADIAVASETSARRLLDEEPRVALLSFSTKGSASHACVDRITEVLAIVRQKAGHLKIDGEFQPPLILKIVRCHVVSYCPTTS